MGETRDWLKFFEQAGIPRSASAQYAVTFIENRISMDMLMDLNKEYLRDMGICKLGDIISILKQAKVMSEKRCADRALSTKLDEELEPKVSKVKKPVVEMPPSNTVSKSKPKPSPSSNSEDKRIVRNKSPVLMRLGPPLEHKFSDSVKKSCNVFKRLGDTEKQIRNDEEVHKNSYGQNERIFPTKDSQYSSKQSPEAKYPFERHGSSRKDSVSHSDNNEIENSSVVRKRIIAQTRVTESPKIYEKSRFVSLKRSNNRDDDDDEVLSYKKKVPYKSSKTTSHGVLNSSPDSNWEKVPVQKRLGQIRPVPAAASGSDEYKEKSKKVKYVMVQTLKDGSQVRKTLRPDDPILKTVPVTRSKVNSLDKFRRSLPISPPKPSSKIISTKKPYEGFSLNRSLPGRSSSDRNSKHHYERNESASNARSQSPVSTYRNKRISPPRESNYDNHNSYFKNNTKKPFYNKRKY